MLLYAILLGLFLIAVYSVAKTFIDAARDKHPRGLIVLFFTELWERFGYYLMIAIFTLYLNEHLKMSEGDAASLYGTYISLVYASPFFGGMIGDKIGHKRSILIGAALLTLGYFILARDNAATMKLALGVLIVGNGMFKPNISTLVGALYAADDKRRDGGFSIFYMGINIGAFFAPLAAAHMRSKYGWGPAFAIGGVGMGIGFATFAIFSRLVKPAPPPEPIQVSELYSELPSEYNQVPGDVARERVRALLIMCSIVMLFRFAFHQNGSTLTYWARDNTDRLLGGLLKEALDPEVFAAINSYFVVVLTPVLVATFIRLRRRGLEPPTPAKIMIGMLLTAVSFAIMVVASLVAGSNSGVVSAAWVSVSYFVVTIGELCLSPLGLSMVTKLAPKNRGGLFMGIWCIATAVGNKLSGELGRLWKPWPHSHFFGILVGTSLLAAFLVAIQLRRLNKAMPDADKE